MELGEEGVFGPRIINSFVVFSYFIITSVTRDRGERRPNAALDDDFSTFALHRPQTTHAGFYPLANGPIYQVERVPGECGLALVSSSVTLPTKDAITEVKFVY